jgi:hypothetical protein
MKIDEQYPTMGLYVGKFFHNPTTKILLIGESHYLPKGSSQHTSPEVWYSGSSHTLSPTEITFISTSEIIEGSRLNRFSNPAHSIWKNSFEVINEFGPRYSDFTRVADDIAFCNFFLRPGLCGKSLLVCPEDVSIAHEAFLATYKKLKPTAIAFLSMKAFSHFKRPPSIPDPIATPHPASSWWNRVAKKYGNKKGRDILRDFVTATNWKKPCAGPCLG